MNTQRKPILSLLSETVSNRIYSALGSFSSRVRTFVSPFTGSISVDESKVNYFLARSLMDGSVIRDDKGVKHGADYVLASAFAAPIVNSMSALLLANPPSAKVDGENGEDMDFNASMSQWYSNNESVIFDAVADSQAEGDAYVYVKNTFDADLVQLAPENVEKIVNPNDYTDTIGYEVKSNKREFDSKGNIIVVKQKIIYRKSFPYKIVIELNSSGKNGTIIEVDGIPKSIPIDNDQLYMKTLSTHDDFQGLFDSSGRFEEKPLPIVHLSFRKKKQHVYGSSVFRNLYVYFLNYHRILDHMIKNVIFNLVNVMYAKGIDNYEDFLKSNGELDESTGEYRLKIDPRRIILGGKDFQLDILNAPNGLDPADTLLTKFFYLIVQASETPEFFFGAAVKSSQASVKEQMPIILNKGSRYQKIYRNQMQDLFDTVIFYKSINGDVTVSPDYEYVFSWGAINLDDKEQLIKLVDSLDSKGLVTRETAGYILGLSNYVDDIQAEIKRADQEDDERNIAMDQLISPNEAITNDDNEEDNIINDVQNAEMVEMIKKRVERDIKNESKFESELDKVIDYLNRDGK